MKRIEDDPNGLRIGSFLEVWGLVELDFQKEYGIDLSSGILKQRSWRWLRLRMVGLLSIESRVQRVLNPTAEQKKMMESSN